MVGADMLDILEECNPLSHCLRRRTEELLTQDHVWGQVVAVAETLLVERSIAGRRVRELMDVAGAGDDHGAENGYQLSLF